MSRKWANAYSEAKQKLEETAYVVSEKMEDMYDEIARLSLEVDSLTRIISGQELELDSCRRIIMGLGHQVELRD